MATRGRFLDLHDDYLAGPSFRGAPFFLIGQFLVASALDELGSLRPIDLKCERLSCAA